MIKQRLDLEALGGDCPGEHGPSVGKGIAAGGQFDQVGQSVLIGIRVPFALDAEQLGVAAASPAVAKATLFPMPKPDRLSGR